MKVFTFGDSWGAGAELKPGDHTFGELISNKLQTTHNNFAVEGYSLATVMFSIIENHHLIEPEDVVFVVIPPDVRWYTINHYGTILPLTIDANEWKQTMTNKPLEWFITHHNLFIYTLYSILLSKKCKFTMMHNYGELKLKPKYESLIDMNVFLSDKSLTYLLCNNEWYNNYNTRVDGPNEEVFKGKYFEGTLYHPNQLGHARIAELINDKMKLYDTN